MSKVVILKTKPKTVIEDYSKLLDLAEYKKHIKKEKPTLLKLNLSWSIYYPACSTQPWQLEGILNKLKEDKYKEVIPCENKTVVTNVWKGEKQNKWKPILDKYNQKLTALQDVTWVNYKPKSDLLALPQIFPNGHKIPEMFLGKNIIHLPTLKTHGHTTTTGAIKNAFGGLITERRHHCHAKIHEILVDLLSIQKEIHPGLFAVMDGTIAGNGAGPRTMVPKEKDYLLASHDQVAIDAISAKMMGFNPMKIKYIKLAHDKGLGIGDPDQIEVIGEDITNINFHFKTKKSPIIFGDQLFRKGALSFIEPLLFHTNLFKLCIFASTFYHDYIWYNTTGRYRMHKFSKTKWNQLFKQY